LLPKDKLINGKEDVPKVTIKHGDFANLECKSGVANELLAETITGRTVSSVFVK
jgi:hypothetical protein